MSWFCSATVARCGPLKAADAVSKIPGGQGLAVVRFLISGFIVLGMVGALMLYFVLTEGKR